jgi:hypothetical protein
VASGWRQSAAVGHRDQAVVGVHCLDLVGGREQRCAELAGVDAGQLERFRVALDNPDETLNLAVRVLGAVDPHEEVTVLVVAFDNPRRPGEKTGCVRVSVSYQGSTSTAPAGSGTAARACAVGVWVVMANLSYRDRDSEPPAQLGTYWA